MGLNPEEVSSIIRKELEKYETKLEMESVGVVLQVGDGIARIHGLENAMAGELLDFPHGVVGLALNLEEDQVGAVLLGDFEEIREGDQVKRTGRIMSVPVGEALVGRVVDPLGRPLDGGGTLRTVERLPVERPAPARHRVPPRSP